MSRPTRTKSGENTSRPTRAPSTSVARFHPGSGLTKKFSSDSTGRQSPSPRTRVPTTSSPIAWKESDG